MKCDLQFPEDDREVVRVTVAYHNGKSRTITCSAKMSVKEFGDIIILMPNQHDIKYEDE